MARLGEALGEVDRKVAGLKQRFENLTKEAAELKIKLDKENETIEAAETLVTKLDGEHQRWNEQVQLVVSFLTNAGFMLDSSDQVQLIFYILMHSACSS